MESSLLCIVAFASKELVSLKFLLNYLNARGRQLSRKQQEKVAVGEDVSAKVVSWCVIRLQHEWC